MDYIIKLTPGEADRLTAVLKGTEAGFNPVNSLVCIDTETEGRDFMAHPVNFGADLDDLINGANDHLRKGGIQPMITQAEHLSVRGSHQALSMLTQHFRWKNLNDVESTWWDGKEAQEYWNRVVSDYPQAFGESDPPTAEEETPEDYSLRYAPSATSVAMALASVCKGSAARPHPGSMSRQGTALLAHPGVIRTKIKEALREYEIPQILVETYWEESGALAERIYAGLSDEERTTLNELLSQQHDS